MLSFSYKQALHSANEARALAEKLQFPFTRPADYFAEMVKSDSHMERIRQRLLDESAGIKKSEDKRKEREGKKFGKQVQVEKLKEREKSKKEMEERLKGLKRSTFPSFSHIISRLMKTNRTKRYIGQSPGEGRRLRYCCRRSNFRSSCQARKNRRQQGKAGYASRSSGLQVWLWRCYSSL